jgi:hypothetical protein
VFGPESFAARCSLRLDFARRHLLRRRPAAPVTILFRPLFFLPLIRITIRERPSQDLFAPLCFNSSGTPKFRGRCTPKRDLQKRVLWEFQLRAGVSVIGRPVQMHGEGLLRLHRKVDLLGRRTQSNQVLGVECTERYQDIGPRSRRCLLPRLAQVRRSKARRETTVGDGARPTDYRDGPRSTGSFARLPRCIIHASPTRSVTIFVHLHPTTRVYGRLDVNLLAVVCLPGSDFHLYKNPPCARLCGLLTGA